MSENNIITHSELVWKLVKSGETIRQELTACQCNVLHLTLALAGEIAELAIPLRGWDHYAVPLDNSNILEEFGDIEFFLEGIRQELGLNYEDSLKRADQVEIDTLNNYSLSHDVESLFIATGRLIDAIKRWAIYRKYLDINEVMISLGNMEVYLESIRRMFSIKRVQTQNNNIEKLSKRYKELSYSDESANERVDKKE